MNHQGRAKMSRAWAHVVSPDDMVERYGADSTRMYTLFATSADRDSIGRTLAWKGVSRFLARCTAS